MAISKMMINIVRFLQEHPNEDFTSQNLADIFGIDSKRKVDGGITSALTRKNLAYRVKSEKLNSKTGLHEPVTYIKLNDEGMKLTFTKEDYINAK